MYSGVMACVAKVLREGAISAVKPKSLRERAYIGGEGGCNMSVGLQNFAHIPQVLEQNRNISVYACEKQRSRFIIGTH